MLTDTQISWQAATEGGQAHPASFTRRRRREEFRSAPGRASVLRPAVKEAIMSHSDTIGGERPASGEPSGLGARLGRFFSPANPRQDQPQETVEFTPEDVVPAEEAWAPRFTTVWRGYDRASVDEYIGALEDELATVRAEHTPEHAIQDEIDRLGNDTAEILRVAHAKA